MRNRVTASGGSKRAEIERAAETIGRHRSRVRLLALPVMVATLFTGCGGGGSSKSSAGSTTSGTSNGSAASGRLSKADFIAQGDAICEANVVKEKAIPQPSRNDLKAVTSYLPRLLSIVTDEDAKLRALKAPAADQATLDAAFTELDTALAAFRKAESAANAGNSAAFQSAAQAAKAPSDDATTRLHAYGFQHCPSPSGSAAGATSLTQAPAP